MAGSDFYLDISELEKLSAAFQRAAGMDIGKLLDEMGIEVEGQIKERFETKKDPEGNNWEDWSDRYGARRKKKAPGASLLMGPNARLQESTTFEITHEGITWGSPLVYARAQDKGRPEINLPARQHLGIGPDDAELLSELIDDFIERESGGIL